MRRGNYIKLYSDDSRRAALKKIIITIVIMLIIFFIARPSEVITAFDLSEATIIMKRTWKVVHEMTNENLETIPTIKVSSKKEFFDIYQFDYFEDHIKSDIFEAIVAIGDDGEVIKDGKGKLVYGGDGASVYIPTLYDEGVFIKRAYLKETLYDEHAHSKVELVIEEESNHKISKWASGFSRTSIFRKNEEGEWLLYLILGTNSYSWER